MHLTIDELIAYIDEERTRWERWFSMNGNAPLKFTLAGETHPNVGALILHCFWKELWYASMLHGEMLTHDSDIAMVMRQHNLAPPGERDFIFSSSLE